MAPSKSVAYSTINKLNESKTSGKIKVRVSRLWEVINPHIEGQIVCIDMVLIDEEGGYVHASIYGDTSIKKFRPKLTEGDVYVMNNFAIETNKTPYRVVSDSKIMLKFQFNTYIRKISSEGSIIPSHRFDFVPFNTLEQRRGKIEVLTDVYGVLVSESVEKDSTTIEIRDISEKLIKVRLWRQFSIDYSDQLKEYRGQCNVIIIVTSTFVRGFNMSSMRLDTSSASKIYIDLEFPKVNELKSLLRENKEEIVVSSVLSQSTSIVKKDISTITNHCKLPYKKNEICYCPASVKEVKGDLSWYNPSCPECNRKPKTEPKGFFCEYCNKSVERPLTVYRLELEVEDETGTTIFTIFNDEAKKLVGQEAGTLFDSVFASQPDEDDEEYDVVPSLLRNTFEGKTFVFKVKIDKFNHQNRNNKKQTFGVMKVLDSNSFEEPKKDKSPQIPTNKRQLEYISSEEEGSDTSTNKIIRKNRKLQD